jgi:cytochrome c oxidase subunit 3
VHEAPNGGGAGANVMAGHHATGHDAHGHNPYLQHHFYSMGQQLEASILGMWVFLVTEIMFFGGMFMAYILYRVQYPEAFLLGSNHLNVTLGALNTGVLICSSLTMALAVRAAQNDHANGLIFLHALRNLAQLLHHLAVHRVHHLRPVERNGSNAAFHR